MDVVVIKFNIKSGCCPHPAGLIAVKCAPIQSDSNSGREASDHIKTCDHGLVHEQQTVYCEEEEEEVSAWFTTVMCSLNLFSH